LTTIVLNWIIYVVGFIGLNNVKANDYVNVVIQVLAHIPPIRDFFMLQQLDDKSELVKRFSTLIRKIWNPSAFKGQVSPHELLQVNDHLLCFVLTIVYSVCDISPSVINNITSSPSLFL